MFEQMAEPEEKRVDDHCRHGGEANVDGGAPVAAVDERINQRAT